ncbi:MAG: hypothetical protein K0R39_2239 [Symbiobacteriaceae bacterium]|jgi:hypothetical protein|nr:hypothetical protein [Symbiobacteriaceae bacterium]
MSLARQFSTVERALPEVERQPRTTTRPRAAKAKKSVAGAVIAGLGWLVVLGLCLFVVHRNTMVVAETNALTLKQEAVNKLDRELEEKSARVNVPIEEVERWAKAHNMKLASTFKSVAIDQNAAAPLPVQPAVTVASVEPAAPKDAGLYAAVKGFFARFTSAKGANPGGN